MVISLFKATPVLVAAAAVTGSLWAAGSANAQSFPITAQQRATATEVAQSGVPLSDLKADAPQSYTVKSGDTLWAISGMYLKAPWRWPALWGMNLNDIKNPHRIYPGQTLYLDKTGGRARLLIQPPDATNPPTVRLSPRTRIEKLVPQSLPTLKPHLIEPFLSEPEVVDDPDMSGAPRIVATQDNRVLLTRGDRAYIRSGSAMAEELVDDPQQPQKAFRIFRSTTPLKDPDSGEILGYQAQYIGRALLARSEAIQEGTNPDGSRRMDIVPATIDVVDAKEEIRVGDRLLPEPPQQLTSYVPRAPQDRVDASIVSVYGSAVANAAQNQVVVINRGTRDGMEVGHVLAIMQAGNRIIDKTDPSLSEIKLPDERYGLLMVFRTFEKLSYALVLEITTGVKVGDRLTNPF